MTTQLWFPASGYLLVKYVRASRYAGTCRSHIGVKPLFMVPRSRSQMSLGFVSPPNDQNADVRFPAGCKVKTSLDAEANSTVRYIL